GAFGRAGASLLHPFWQRPALVHRQQLCHAGGADNPRHGRAALPPRSGSRPPGRTEAGDHPTGSSRPPDDLAPFREGVLMGTTTCPTSSPAGADQAGRWAHVVAVLASSMVFIDGTALNVALPALQESLGASGADLLLVVNAYALILTALLLLGGA